MNYSIYYRKDNDLYFQRRFTSLKDAKNFIESYYDNFKGYIERDSDGKVVKIYK